MEKIKEFLLMLNEKGIPLPLIRDKGKGSYTATMFWISFNIAILMLIGKVTHFLGEVDYSNVLWLLGITGTFHFGGKFEKNGNNMSVETKNPNQEPPL